MHLLQVNSVLNTDIAVSRKKIAFCCDGFYVDFKQCQNIIKQTVIVVNEGVMINN